MNAIENYSPKMLSGRNRRLLHEWQTLEQGLNNRSDISYRVLTTNAEGLPTAYLVNYSIRSISGVTHMEHLNEPGVSNEPVYHDHFTMQVTLPAIYPQVDGAPVFSFLTHDAEGHETPHPWHPNIRYFGAFAGRVCINMVDTYCDLLWAVRRIASYLRYDTYHATLEPPHPEDLQVAAWVRSQGEPNGWLAIS